MAILPLQSIPLSARLPVAKLAAVVIDLADASGRDRWGLTPYADAIRVNVGWTEILTAAPDFVRLVVDGERATAVALPDEVTLTIGDDERGFYPTVPGSMLATIPYEPTALLELAIEALRPALVEAIRLAARRSVGRGVKAGHQQEAVLELEAVVRRQLPIPSYAYIPPSNTEPSSDLMEGALLRVVSSKYERNGEARDKCIEHYGASCFVCEFSFEKVFGQLGAGFIHVHHVVPLASVGQEYKVDPITDLRPVCPNCHAMLHRQDPPLTVDELKSERRSEI